MNKFKHFTEEELSECLDYGWWADCGGKLLPPLDVACNVLNDALDKRLVQRTKKHIFTLDELGASNHACRNWLDLVISENNPGVKLSLALTGAKPLSLVFAQTDTDNGVCYCYVVRNGEGIAIDFCCCSLFDNQIHDLSNKEKDILSYQLLNYARRIQVINRKFRKE